MLQNHNKYKKIHIMIKLNKNLQVELNYKDLIMEQQN